MAGATYGKRSRRFYRQDDHLYTFQDRTGESEAPFWSRKVIVAPDIDGGVTLTTDGEIAIANLDSARRRSWSRFFEDPMRDQAAETVVENEMLTLQFVGDVSALDRVEFLAAQFAQGETASARVAL